MKNTSQNLKETKHKTPNDRDERQKGITLIALVITVIVLLILAGTAITLSINGGNLFSKTNEAANEWNAAVEYEESAIESIFSYIELDIPEGLKVGDIVEWKPSGHYIWDKDVYASSESGTVYVYTSGASGYSTNYTIETKELYSGKSAENAKDVKTTWNGGINLDFTIDEWKVLSVNENKKEVRLVPTKVTIPVILQGATGYNNGVKLLNDACRALYEGNKIGIEVHNINMEDLEGIKNADGTVKKAGLMTETDSETDPIKTAKDTYGETYTIANSSNIQYPTIYAEEALRKIINSDDTINESKTGLGLSDERENFITRENEKVTKTEANTILTKTVKELNPTNTYYYLNNAKFTSALGTTNAGIILPNGTKTHYWVASRDIFANSRFCNFGLRSVSDGGLAASAMIYSSNIVNAYAFGLFPVVTISSGTLTSKETANTFEYTPVN